MAEDRDRHCLYSTVTSDERIMSNERDGRIMMKKSKRKMTALGMIALTSSTIN